MFHLAANEVRAISAVIDAQLPHLHTQLTALFYIKGHVIIATADPPVTQNTLAFGSSGSGDFYSGNDSIMKLISQLAQTLNMQKYLEQIQRAPPSETCPCLRGM